MRSRTAPSRDGGGATAEDRALWSALGDANIPVLIMLLVQTTGDRRWLRPPYAPSRTRGMEDNNSGGLSEQLQSEVRLASFDAIRELSRDAPAAGRAAPTPDAMAEMMTVCMGEQIPSEYGELMLEEMGLHSRWPEWPSQPDPQRLANFRALIIGAGASGICAAIALRHAGIPFTVFERSGSVGGTWFQNAYPGCGVDTPSHLYSFSFAPRNWTRYFARQPEILLYLRDCADRFGVSENIELETEVLAATWQPRLNKWKVAARGPDGAVTDHSFNVVLSAVGQLNVPWVPPIPGAEQFSGPRIHSAQWPAELEVTGRRVAVIGTGASAMQLVPTISQAGAEVKLFQRSPQWAIPTSNYRREVPAGVRYLIDNVPLYRAWYRCRLVWSNSDTVHSSLQIDPEWPGAPHSINVVNSGHRRYLTRHLTNELSDRPDLIRKALPDYPPFAKRMLLDNGWFECLARPNVELIDAGISAITDHGVQTTDGRVHPTDILVYATGFQTLRMIGSYDVRGAEGRSLRDYWGEDDARAYLGMAVHGFPNFFCLYGPNTGLGHGGSVILLSECATRYIVTLLQRMILDDVPALDVRRTVFDDYNASVDKAHERMIWSQRSTNNWYRNHAGRVVTNMPWRIVDYWRMTREPDLGDFTLSGRDSQPDR